MRSTIDQSLGTSKSQSLGSAQMNRSPLWISEACAPQCPCSGGKTPMTFTIPSAWNDRRQHPAGKMTYGASWMPVSVVFRCEICGARPDPGTQVALERQLLDLRHGEYVDADPGRWLTWHGRGIYGPTRYACGEHRGELKAVVREQYGTLGWHPWAIGPHPWAGRRGTDRARQLVRRLGSTFGPPG